MNLTQSISASLTSVSTSDEWLPNQTESNRCIYFLVTSESSLQNTWKKFCRGSATRRSHRPLHQTLKCSLSRQQREFCQFPNGLRQHDLFISLTFSSRIWDGFSPCFCFFFHMFFFCISPYIFLKLYLTTYF